MSLRLVLVYLLVGLMVLLRVMLSRPIPLTDGQKVDTTIRLLTSPSTSGSTQQLPVFINNQRVSLTLSRFSEYHYGDLLHIKGTIEKKLLEDRRIVYSMYLPTVTVVTNNSGLPFHLAGFIRERVEEGFGRYLSPNDAGLLQGIVFGISSGLEKEVKLEFQITGVTHVIAASGMNVTLLSGFLLPLFLHTTKRRDALLLTIICLGFYAIISGLSASIVRATIMGSIALVGLIFGRQRTAFVSFFLTGCIMIGITPSVITDIGFQLSFCATAGMLLLMPLVSMIPGIRRVGLVKDDLSATISAQIATMPLLLYYFHSLGLLSVLVNALVLWTIPILMIIGSLAALASLVSVSVGGLMALLALPFLRYFTLINAFFAQFSPVLTLESMPVSLLVGYYLLLAAIILRLRKGLS